VSTADGCRASKLRIKSKRFMNEDIVHNTSLAIMVENRRSGDCIFNTLLFISDTNTFVKESLKSLKGITQYD
jgi:hypothetical protein